MGEERELKWVQRVHFIVGIWGRQAFWTLPHVLWRIKSSYTKERCARYVNIVIYSLSLSLLIYWAICPHLKFNEFLYIDSHSLPSHNHLKCEEQRAAAAKKQQKFVAFHVHVHVLDIFRMMSVPNFSSLSLSFSRSLFHGLSI